MKFCELWLREWINPNINSYKLIKQIIKIGYEINNIKSINKYLNIKKIYIKDFYKNNNNKKIYLNKIIFNKFYFLIINVYKNFFKNKYIFINFKKKKNFFYIKSTLNFFKKKNISIKYNEIINNNKKNNNNINKYLQIKDNIIDININPNRSDCFCYKGISREIAIKNKINIKEIITKIIKPKINSKILIFINSPFSCPKYLIRIFKNLKNINKTPIWMKEKLKRCNLISKNILKNITNYVMIESGQPINIYDLDKIYNNKIIIKKTKKTKITKINNKIIKIYKNTLIISNNKKIISIAGICINKEFLANKFTKNIIIECACFNPIEIKKNLNLYKKYKNKNSIYFEKGIDPFIQEKIIERISKLIICIYKGTPSQIINITNPNVFKKPKKINFKINNIKKITGISISKKKINNILNYLSFKKKNINKKKKILIPSWRFDINTNQDIIEDIIRINGIDILPKKKNICINEKKYINLKKIKTLLINQGYQEIITYSFVNYKIQKLLHAKKIGIKLKNPISKNMSEMRISLCTGLINSLIFNQNKQHQSIRFFETGLRFINEKKTKKKIRQDFLLSGLINGLNSDEHWNLQNKEVNYFNIKGDIENIFKITNKLKLIKFKKYKNNILNPKKSIGIFINNKLIGYIGELNSKLIKQLKIKKKTLLFELIWKKIKKINKKKIKKISIFPIIRRDICIIVKNDILSEKILKECKKIFLNKLIKINIFDIYKNNIKKNYKSLTISLIIQNLKKTMTEKEINKIIQNCIKILKIKFNINIRK